MTDLIATEIVDGATEVVVVGTVREPTVTGTTETVAMTVAGSLRAKGKVD